MMRMINCLVGVAINPAAFCTIRSPRYPQSILTTQFCSVLALICRSYYTGGVITPAAANPPLLTKGQLPAGVRSARYVSEGTGFIRGGVSGWGRRGFIFFHAVTQTSLSLMGVELKKKKKKGGGVKKKGGRKKSHWKMDQPQQACMSPFMQARSTASLLGMRTGTCVTHGAQRWPGERMEREQRATAYTTSRGGAGGQPACAHTGRGGQDGQTVTEIHGKGNMEKEIINKCLKKPTKLRIKLGGRWKGTALQNDASLRGMLG